MTGGPVGPKAKKYLIGVLVFLGVFAYLGRESARRAPPIEEQSVPRPTNSFTPKNYVDLKEADSLVIFAADTNDRIKMVAADDRMHWISTTYNRGPRLTARDQTIHRASFRLQLAYVEGEIRGNRVPIKMLCSLRDILRSLHDPVPPEFVERVAAVSNMLIDAMPAKDASACERYKAPTASSNSGSEVTGGVASTSASGCQLNIDAGATLNGVSCEETKGVVVILAAHNYSCRSISGISRSQYSTKPKYTVFCEQDRYHYVLTDVGGAWQVEVR